MSEFIAEAQVLIVPNTAAFAASLRAQLEAAVLKAGPVAIPIVAEPVAKGAAAAVAAETATATAATKAQTAALAENVVAQQLDGAAAVKDAQTQVVNARAHAQATRAIEAQAASLAGLRGAVLTASTPFLVATAVAVAFAKSIQQASNETEQINKVLVIFGQSAQEVEDFAKTTASSLGISSEAALEAAGIFGNLFRSIHIATPEAAGMSIELVKLASDLASFNNADPSRTLEALRSGLVGQARPLRVFGIFLSQARAQQEALIETGKKNVKELTNAEIVQARYNIILKDSALAQGDFARTSDRLANQSRILKAQLSDLGVQLGRVLIPALTNTISGVNNVIQVFGDLQKIAGKVGDAFPETTKKAEGFRLELARILAPGAEFKAVSGSLLGILDKLAGVEDKAAGSTHALADSLDAGARAAQLAAFALVQAQKAVSATGQSLAALEIQALKIQTGLTAGGRGGEETNLRAQIAADKQAVAESKSGTKARRDALLALKADQDALAGLLQQDASDAQDRAQKIKDAAAKQKAAAEKAAQAQADATQAFIESFTKGRQGLQNALQRAGLDDTLKNEIALNKKIISFDLAEIRAIRDRIRHLHLHGEALKAAQEAIRRINQEITDTRIQIQKDQQAQQEAAKALVIQRLDLRIQLAQARDNTQAEIKARSAKLEELTKELARLKNAGKKNTIAWLELKVQQAEEIAAIKDLEKKNKEKKNAQASLFFQFLQTQQGFAANLLGNLIPGFATGGLVGGSAAGAAATGGFGQPGGPQPGGGVIPGMDVSGHAAVAASRDRGVRPVQVDTTNQLLRQILRSLQNLNGRTQHPEARHNRAVGSAVLDTMGGVHGA